MAEALLKALAPNLAVNGDLHLTDFLVTGYMAVALLAARVLGQLAILPLMRRKLDQRTAFAVFDNLWIASFSGALCLYAWYVTLYANGGCKPWATGPCFEGWPHHATSLAQRWYMLSMFGYYLYEMIGTAINVGTKLKADMITHHIVTMILIVTAYEVNVIRMCCMWTALFDLSNPILHLAKAMDKIKVAAIEGPKWATFATFALTFLVCRIIMGPISVVLPSFTGTAFMPASFRYPCQAMMVFIQVLQCIWFYKIVQIATGKNKSKEE